MTRLNEPISAHRLIPGGAHTYSKGDDQFPANAPRTLERGKGCHVWDADDRRFLDWTMGLRTMTLGYGRQEIDEAAISQIKKGLNFGRPSLLETSVAQELIDLVPCAEMVKFAKNGSTVTTAAIKLARAYTDRRYVAYCQDHPFYSYDDWFIGTTEANAGIPLEHYQFSVPFRYNDLSSLEAVFANHPGDVAAVIMEPCIAEPPANGFLHNVAALCRNEDSVFILDEMITGFRWSVGGAQEYFDVRPDLATFGKGMANGHSVSALVGRKEIMELGGIEHDRPRVFLISTTHGAENLGLSAALACLKIYRSEPVVEHIWSIGEQLMAGVNEASSDMGIGAQFNLFGYACRPEYKCLDADGTASPGLRTLFNQEMVRQGIILPYIVPSNAHTELDVDQTVDAARQALKIYVRALEDGWQKYLDGPPIKPVFRKFN